MTDLNWDAIFIAIEQTLVFRDCRLTELPPRKKAGNFLPMETLLFDPVDLFWVIYYRSVIARTYNNPIKNCVYSDFCLIRIMYTWLVCSDANVMFSVSDSPKLQKIQTNQLNEQKYCNFYIYQRAQMIFLCQINNFQTSQFIYYSNHNVLEHLSMAAPMTIA